MSAIRLNKALASAGVCSRRKADDLIAAGAVSVNGSVVTELGLRVTPGTDSVTVHGKAVVLAGGTPEPGAGKGVAAQSQSHTYILLHKPIQVVSTASDPEGRTTVLDFLPEYLQHKRLYPVGRLDYFSEGLLLLTDDGELTHRLTHPRYHLPKVYEVRVREIPTKGMMRAIRHGMTLREGEVLAPVDADTLADDPKTLVLTLHQGINRQIRRMCRDLGLTILSLRRMQLGPVFLEDLPKGECRPLRARELAALKEAVGLAY